MTKFFFSIALLLLTLNLMTSCGNTESATEETKEDAQNAPTKAGNAIMETGTYEMPTEIQQAMGNLQTEINSKAQTLQADLNGADKDEAITINKKIGYLKEYKYQLSAYQEKATKISEVDAAEFSIDLTELINKIERDVASF